MSSMWNQITLTFYEVITIFAESEFVKFAESTEFVKFSRVFPLYTIKYLLHYPLFKKWIGGLVCGSTPA